MRGPGVCEEAQKFFNLTFKILVLKKNCKNLVKTHHCALVDLRVQAHWTQVHWTMGEDLWGTLGDHHFSILHIQDLVGSLQYCQTAPSYALKQNNK